jgi:hypothetical protein
MAEQKKRGAQLRKEEIQGQPQAASPEPHDGKVQVYEVDVRLDEQVLDPNSELAVQIPEEAKRTPEESHPMAAALVAEDGSLQSSPEEQLGSQNSSPSKSKKE